MYGRYLFSSINRFAFFQILYNNYEQSEYLEKKKTHLNESTKTQIESAKDAKTERQ